MNIGSMTKRIEQPKKLKQIATREVRSLINRLPSQLQSKIAAVAVVLELKPGEDRIAEGTESDLLGLFVGPSLRDGEGGAPLPPQIFLFLENIRAEAFAHGRSYREELRRTFLHELGHYLGLEENDLKLRNID